MRKILGSLMIMFAILMAMFGIYQFAIQRAIAKQPQQEITPPSQVVQNQIGLTYYSNKEKTAKLDLQVTDEAEINTVMQQLANYEFEDYSMLDLYILGKYEMHFQNGITLSFDETNNAYVMYQNNGASYISKMPITLKQWVVEKVNTELQKTAQLFNTNSIAVTNPSGFNMVIQEETALKMIIDNCKDIIADNSITGITPEYQLDFSNGVVLQIATTGNYVGKLHNTNTKEEKYVIIPQQLIENLRILINNYNNNVATLFNTNTITLIKGSKTVQITDLTQVNTIISSLKYSKIEHYTYIDSGTFELKIGEEDVKMLINGNTIVIYANKTYGTDSLIYTNGKVDGITISSELEAFINTLITQ